MVFKSSIARDMNRRKKEKTGKEETKPKAILMNNNVLNNERTTSIKGNNGWMTIKGEW